MLICSSCCGEKKGPSMTVWQQLRISKCTFGMQVTQASLSSRILHSAGMNSGKPASILMLAFQHTVSNDFGRLLRDRCIHMMQ